MSFGKHRQKISPNILFYKSQNITYVHFRPNVCFLYAKRQIKLEIFPPLFALNYLQIIICTLFANKNYLQINLPSIIMTLYWTFTSWKMPWLLPRHSSVKKDYSTYYYASMKVSIVVVSLFVAKKYSSILCFLATNICSVTEWLFNPSWFLSWK